MPGSCWGKYKRVAVIELEDDCPADFVPAMISERSKGVKRIVRTWEKLNVGKTEHCAFGRAMDEARKLVEGLSNQ
jgi:hypothetical protein